MFLRRRRRRPTPAPAANKAKPSDPFAAIPQVSELAEAREDSQGGIQIKMELPEKPGVKEFLARKMGMRRAVRVNLDEHGSRYWRLINGRRPLSEIEKKLRKEMDLEAEESRQAVVLFTKMLMTRHLINLKIPRR